MLSHAVKHFREGKTDLHGGNGSPRAHFKHLRARDLSSARNTSPRARMIIPHMLTLDLLSPARANTFIFVSRGAGLAGLIVTSNVIGYSPFPEDSIGCLL